MSPLLFFLYAVIFYSACVYFGKNKTTIVLSDTLSHSNLLFRLIMLSSNFHIQHEDKELKPRKWPEEL